MKTFAFQLLVAGTQFANMIIEIGRGNAGGAVFACLTSCIGLAGAYAAYRRVAA